MSAFVFVHGGASNARIWKTALTAMEVQHGVGLALLALDVPGCGAKRGRNKDGIGIPEIAAELIGEIEAAGLKDVVLVGHSQAGTVIPSMLRARASLFRRVVYVSCAAPEPGRTVSQQKEELYPPEEMPKTPEEIRALVTRMMGNDMTPEQLDNMLAKIGQDSWPSLAYVKTDWLYGAVSPVPATYIHLLQDQAIPPPLQDIFARRLSCDRVFRIDSGHQVMNTRPHALAEVLLQEVVLGF